MYSGILRVVDSANPVLYLHNHTSVLGDSTREGGVIAEKTLGTLQGHGTVHAVAGVKLESLLVCNMLDLAFVSSRKRYCEELWKHTSVDVKSNT